MRSFLSLSIAALLQVGAALPANQSKPQDSHADQYVDWRTFKGYGVNLGGWLEQESTIDTKWWAKYSHGAADEWTMCAKLGSACASVFETRYKTYISTSDIDTLAEAGVTVLRIPTTYAAWIDMPGSQLYHGNQQKYLRRIAQHAITKHNMHVVIDIHSLPGGTNGLDIGEAVGHYGWYYNSTALDWSLKAVDALVDFVASSPNPWSYTIEPINEPVDNRDFSTFGTPAALSDKGAKWVVKYIRAVLDHVEKVDDRIPVMFQGSFKPETYWSGFFEKERNLVFDAHHYYFQYPNATSVNLPTFICKDAKDTEGDGKFPVFVGEWSIQAGGNNTLSLRGENLRAGISAWAQYTQGSSFWTAKFSSNVTAAGQGMQENYWNFAEFIEAGYLEGDVVTEDYC